MSLIETRYIPDAHVNTPLTKDQEQGADGSMYLHWALTDYHGSLTSQAAYFALHSKTTGYQPEELGNAILRDTTRVRDVTGWVNQRNVIPEVNSDEVVSAASTIISFAQRMSALSTEQLSGVIAGYPAAIGARGAPQESALRRKVNTMIFEATNDRSLGYGDLYPKSHPEPTEIDIFVANAT